MNKNSQPKPAVIREDDVEEGSFIDEGPQVEGGSV